FALAGTIRRTRSRKRHAQLHHHGLSIALRFLVLPGPALGGNAADFLDIGIRRIEIAQIEAVDTAIWNINGADSLGRFRCTLFFVLLFVLGGEWFELSFA